MTGIHHIPIRRAIALFGLLVFALGFLITFNRYPPKRMMNKILREAPQALSNLKTKIKFGLEPATIVTKTRTAPSTVLPLTRPSIATGPLRVHPTNPRYFTDDSGKAVYLTGSHTWSNFQDNGGSNPPPVFDYEAYLNFLQENNHNFFRLWAWEQARWTVETSDDNYWFYPLPYERVGPDNALDGQPKFDLTRFNQAYFDRMRARVQVAGEQGIYVSIMLFDGWSIEKAKGQFNKNNPWRGHPFNKFNNINGIDGDLNGDDSGEETHTLSISAITALQEAYVRKVIDTVNDLDNVLYEISNESHAESAAWQIHMINYIKDYEARQPKQHPVGMTAAGTGGDYVDLLNSPADWISPDFGDGTNLINPRAANGSKVILADTDHLCGVCGDQAWVWKSFTRGQNVIFMDAYDGAGYGVGGEGYHLDNPQWVSIRRNMGFTLAYANRMNLAAMRPLPDLSSSGYCLANPAPSGAEYLVFLPSGGSVTLDLSGTQGELLLEWLNPETGGTLDGGKTNAGGNRLFIAPFTGDAVLYIYSKSSLPLPSNPTTSHRIFLPIFNNLETSTINTYNFTLDANQVVNHFKKR